MGFSFGAADAVRLARDLPEAAISELERALSVPHRTTRLVFTGERRLLTRIEALLREMDSQGGTFPPEMRRWLDVRAHVARLNVEGGRRADRQDERRRRKGGSDPAFRPVVESLTLRVMKRHGLKTGGPRAARVLAVALRARLGIQVGEEIEQQLQALQRARRRLRAYDPLDPRTRPSGRLSSDMEEWGDDSLRPV